MWRNCGAVSRPANSAQLNDLSAREVLAANLIRLRAERGWSQEALALEAGLHRTFVAHVERQARNISLDNLERLALALEVAPYKLLKR
ncbi:helix-turn-helix domain-containing protein [Variovorax sp. JS1663]|uniref:helix-turn-helix domain-containing protein n=1 Tax=Variovorax sp. JS1663 TaxID=1851577 RepID=UPI000B348449|nr:helix-turn-helix transcriptional regulator [Variovorax sp. JS1663]